MFRDTREAFDREFTSPCNAMKLKLMLATMATAMAMALPARAQQACRAYTVDRPGTAYGYEEINNCPMINGTFANEDWRVAISGWEPAAYRYQGTDRSSGNSIELFDFYVTGTTERPQYRFRNGDTTYVVTFRYSDPDTIRLEVYQGGNQLINELLYR